MYYIEIQTANVADAGTDGSISVEFVSANGKKSKKQLLDNSGNDFERNDHDFYSFPGHLDEGDSLKSISITHSGGTAWKLSWLKVSIAGRTWKATANTWLNNESKTFSLSHSVGTATWMSTLNPTATVDQINIPGTHDSGTSFLGSANYHRTQDLNILEQLLAGIRHLDMRLRCVVNPDWNSTQPAAQHTNFTIHHEADWCYLYFDKKSWVNPDDDKTTKGYVLQDVLQFLQWYPSEFVLLQVSREHNDEPGFDQYFKGLVGRHDASKFLITDHYPTYAEAKGKIVILNANSALTNYGIPLNLPKFLDTPTLFVENHWMDSNKEIKWNKVEAALKVAMQKNPGQWVINYVSDGSGALSPWEFAKYLNQWVADFITANDMSGHKHYGTVLFDYPTRSALQKMLAKNLS